MSPIRLRVLELRTAKGWSQSDLAEHAGGIRQATISDYESGRVNRPDLRILERIADALGVDVGYLFVHERRPAKRKGKK